MANKLVVRQTLGRNPNVRNCLTYVTDHHLAYVCGFQVVVINTETKEQNFISGTSTYQHQSLAITALASNVGKRMIAVAEKVEPTAIVTFYDAVTLRRKKMLTHAELGSNEIRAMAFSEDGRFLVTQSAGPEWNLTLWNVEKGAKYLCAAKIALSDETPVHRVSFCPWDPTVILVIGKSILRLFRYIEGQLRPMSITVRRDQANFISFAWLSEEQLVVGTEGGEIIIIESFEVRGAIMTSKEDADEFYPVLCLHATARGFVMGSWHGELKVFEKHEDLKEKYQLEDTFYIPGDCGHVMEIAMGADETIICGMDRHHILTSTLSSLHNIKKGENVFEHIFTNFHHPNAKNEAEITGIDVAIWKNVVATCGKDNTVRVWNPVERKMELTREFDEEPLGLSMHPTGIYLAVMFTDKIRILSLLLDEMHPCREIGARQVSYIKFSRGGQYLAASNGTNLQVYATHTGQPVATLRGHNNRIKSVVWMNFDSRVVTMGAEGIVHVWDLFPVTKRMEHFPGTVPISTGVTPLDGQIAYIATHDKLVKELNVAAAADGGSSSSSNALMLGSSTIATTTTNAAGAGTAATGPANSTIVPGATTVGSLTAGGGGGAPGGLSAAGAATAVASSGHAMEGVIKVQKSVELSSYVSVMLFDENRRFLVMGTAAEVGPSSVVVAMTAPSLALNTMEINNLHAAPITAMALSYDGNTIYSADANGCVVISEYEGSQLTSALVNNNNNANGAANGTSPSKNGGSNASNNNGGKGATTVTNANGGGGKQKEGTFFFEFQDEVVIHKTDLENRKNSIEQLHQQVEELNQNNEHQMRLKEMEFRDKLKEITDQATVQLKAEKIKYDELDQEKRSLEKTFAEKVKVLEDKHAEELSGIENKYKSKYNAEENRHKVLMEETKEAHDRWNEENKMLVQSHQKYMEELSRDYEVKIVVEQTTQKDIQVHKEKVSVKFDALKVETEFDGDNEIAEIKIKYDSLLRAEEELKQQLAAQHTVLEKNLQTLVKEQENMELENKRMKDKQARVMESIHTQEKDIQSHKKEIREREETINDKDKRIYDLKKKNQELEKFRFVLDYKIKELKLQITPRENEIATMTKQIEEMNAELDQYNKSNLALNLMIDELKLKMEGIKAELRAQDDRCAISERFLEKFRRDVQELWTSRHDTNGFKVAMIRMYRVYVQEDVSSATLSGQVGGHSSGGSGHKRDLDDPQQVYNRDREQMERSLDSLRRAMKTEAVAHRRDMGKMLRESVLLTKELNTLRKNFRSLYLQKKAIEQGGELGVHSNLADLIEILGLQQKKSHGGGLGKNGRNNKRDGDATGNPMLGGDESTTAEGGEGGGAGTAASHNNNSGAGKIPKPPSMRLGSNNNINNNTMSRTTALRTTSAEGIMSRSGDRGGGLAKGAVSRQDQWEAWREIQLQYDSMKELEDRIGEVCSSLGMDPIPLIVSMDTKLGE